jgi:hypothetical protein
MEVSANSLLPGLLGYFQQGGETLCFRSRDSFNSEDISLLLV